MMKPVILAEDFLLEKIANKLIRDVRIDRSNSITSVFAAMLRNHTDNHAVGLIDKDKTITAPYFKFFAKTVAENEDLLLCRSEKYQFHSIVFVKPASEKWLWKASESVTVPAAAFNLGENIGEFVLHTKGEANSRNPKLAEFIGAVARAEPPMFAELQAWLTNELTRTP